MTGRESCLAFVALVGVAAGGSASFGDMTATGSVSPDPGQWKYGGVLYVGYTGDGTATVNGGSELVTQTAFLNYMQGGTATMRVDGAGSTWTNAMDVYVGYAIGSSKAGTGVLNITDGAKVTVGAASGSTVHVGFGSITQATGTVTVDGNVSTLTYNAYLEVGQGGTSGAGVLNVTDGGQVINGGLYSSHSVSAIGMNGSAGTVNVDGIGSLWQAGQELDIYLKAGITDILRITDGGTVEAGLVDNSGVLAMNVGDGSLLDIGTGTMNNWGKIQLTAAAGTAPGVYTPIVAGTWGSNGTVQAVGGTWNSSMHTFTVVPEPASLGLVGAGVLMLMKQRRGR